MFNPTASYVVLGIFLALYVVFMIKIINDEVQYRRRKKTDQNWVESDEYNRLAVRVEKDTEMALKLFDPEYRDRSLKDIFKKES